MRLRKILFIVLILFSVPLAGVLIFFSMPLVGVMSVSLFGSDFDKFAIKLVQRLGSDSKKLATGRVLQYLEKNGIDKDDRVAFFEQNMEPFWPKQKITDDDISVTQRNSLLERGFISSQCFYKKFSPWPFLIGYRELRICFYEKENGELVFKAFSFITAL